MWIIYDIEDSKEKNKEKEVKEKEKGKDYRKTTMIEEIIQF